MAAEKAIDDLLLQTAPEPVLIIVRGFGHPSLTGPEGWCQRLVEASPSQPRPDGYGRFREAKTLKAPPDLGDDLLHDLEPCVMNLRYVIHIGTSMGSTPLIKDVLERMAQLDVTQSELALACNLSQPHLSKVLTKRTKLAEKTARKLSAWLDATGGAGRADPNDVVRSFATRLETLRPAKRMQIMELLKAVERLIET